MPKPTLKYLAPYIHRVAISDKRIVSRWMSSRSPTRFVLPRAIDSSPGDLDGDKFVRSFAQHVLPRGLVKVRHYGWMSANSKIRLARK